MNDAVPLLAALYAGLAGSTHCLGMCGGIAALGGTGSVRPAIQVPVYNLGRIVSYVVAGMIGATAFRWLAGTLPVDVARSVVTIVASIILIGLGIYFLSGRSMFGALEAVGRRVWQKIAPVTRHFLPIRRPRQAFALGLLWGWLPCGLVYMVLPMAWATASPADAALVMLMFGLGTSPAMLAVGFGGAGLRTRLRRPLVRRLAGGVLVASGLFFLLWPYLPRGGHEHHEHVAAEFVRPAGPRSGPLLTAVKQNGEGRVMLISPGIRNDRHGKSDLRRT
ncbi:MAG: sulfite exporter TauE/SafE family protein [Candidatus Competibacterales bacterium]|nr:sulfite exporter TauE/SafE family protein [Candidatus Competibacterales bacterium]